MQQHPPQKTTTGAAAAAAARTAVGISDGSSCSGKGKDSLYDRKKPFTSLGFQNGFAKMGGVKGCKLLEKGMGKGLQMVGERNGEKG